MLPINQSSVPRSLRSRNETLQVEESRAGQHRSGLSSQGINQSRWSCDNRKITTRHLPKKNRRKPALRYLLNLNESPPQQQQRLFSACPPRQRTFDSGEDWYWESGLGLVLGLRLGLRHVFGCIPFTEYLQREKILSDKGVGTKMVH